MARVIDLQAARTLQVFDRGPAADPVNERTEVHYAAAGITGNHSYTLTLTSPVLDLVGDTMSEWVTTTFLTRDTTPPDPPTITSPERKQAKVRSSTE